MVMEKTAKNKMDRYNNKDEVFQRAKEENYF
jgi:hypothetical protein